MSYLEDPLYQDAIKLSDKKEFVKSMDFWVPLMNKYIGRDSMPKDELFRDTLMVEFLQALFGYASEINRDNIFADDSEEEQEDEGEEGDDESESDDEPDQGNSNIKNTKFFQFGLKEEDDIELSDDEDENIDTNTLGIKDFQELLTGGRRAFHSIADFILNIVNRVQANKHQNSIYIILADCYKELDNIKDSINYYNMALDKTPSTDNNGKICVLLRISELIKWSDEGSATPKYHSIYKNRLAEAIQLIQSSQDEEYLPILPGLREELDELTTQSTQDIRVLHPEFDSVLKRALGQISTDSIDGEKVNDLSSLVQKKKPKKK